MGAFLRNDISARNDSNSLPGELFMGWSPRLRFLPHMNCSVDLLRPLASALVCATLWPTASCCAAEDLYRMAADSQSRVSSFENLNGVKGEGGKTNSGAKGNATESLKAGESKTLLDIHGSGVVQRIWATVDDRSPEMLRSLRLRVYWDGAAQPAIDVPFGDFFCAGLGRITPFQSSLFSSPEGKSFNCYIPMPFRKGARVVISNEGKDDLRALFFDVDFVLQPVPNDMLYFHAHWTRRKISPSDIGKDFELLPRIVGRGRFLGVNFGVNLNSAYPGTWFGEGEVKMYLDGDGDHPTIVGTGTEDYIGTGWGEGHFAQLYQGCTVAEGGSYACYRFHVPDAIWFHKDFRATLQEIGGGDRDTVVALEDKGATLDPVSVNADGTLVGLLDPKTAPDLHDPKFANDWVLFYRSDDYSAVSYFYLDHPTDGLPALAPNADRLP